MPFGADHQRVDVELEQALAVPDGEGLDREHRIDGAADIAFRPAAIAERLCVRPANIGGMLQRARQRREKRVGEAVE